MRLARGLAVSVSIAWIAFLAPSTADAQFCGVQGPVGAYLNARFGFEVDYAGGWHRLQIGAREDEFLWICRDTLVVQGTVLDVDHVTFSDERTRADSLWKAVTQKAALFCDADGVEGGSYCEGPEAAETFVSGHGRPVLKFFQTLVYENYAEDTVEKHRVGPYFAVDISQPGKTRALLLTSEMHRGASDRYAEFVEGMVQSVRAAECECR